MRLLSSNPNKIREFREILWDKLEIEEWKDLKEVDWTSREVIIYKALEAWKGCVVEDTIVEIEWKEIVDIRWNIDWLQKYLWNNIQCIVHLWYNTGDSIIIYKWLIDWTISTAKWESWFWFDPFFIPDWETRTLAQLDSVGLKHKFSARKIALENLLEENIQEVLKIKDIPEWVWEYQ